MPGPHDELDVLIEPMPGHTVEEVVQRLHDAGATNVDVLAPGFVSARGTREVLRSLESIAISHPKAEKAPRSPR